MLLLRSQKKFEELYGNEKPIEEVSIITDFANEIDNYPKPHPRVKFSNTIAGYKNRLDLSQKLFNDSYSKLNNKYNFGSIVVDLSSFAVKEHYASIIYRSFTFKALGNKVTEVPQVRISCSLDEHYCASITYGEHYYKNSFSSIDEMLEGIDSWFEQNVIPSQDEKDVYDIIT